MQQLFLNVQSEKLLYGQQLKMATLNFNAETFIWGEDLIDKQLILYPHKLKDIAEYESVKINLEPCGLVVIDSTKQRGLHCVTATVDIVTGNVYLSERFFNTTWKMLKNSIHTGILLAKKNSSCPIEVPEDILNFKHLERSGSTPVLSKDLIVYRAKEITEEEKHKNSKKQSLLDNPRMLYFYDRNGTCFHDKDCEEVHTIQPENLVASEKMPDLDICPQCQWKVYLRKACYPNNKQIAICEKILKDHNVSVEKLRHCVLEVGMKFHATTLMELMVEGVDDTWIIKGLQNKHCTLWHNNYVRISFTDRYFTEGFHKQNLSNKTLTQMLYYIEDYSYEKHLEIERQTKEEIEEKSGSNQIPMDNKEQKKATEKGIWRILKDGIEKIKTFLKNKIL